MESLLSFSECYLNPPLSPQDKNTQQPLPSPQGPCLGPLFCAPSKACHLAPEPGILLSLRLGEGGLPHPFGLEILEFRPFVSRSPPFPSGCPRGIRADSAGTLPLSDLNDWWFEERVSSLGVWVVGVKLVVAPAPPLNLHGAGARGCGSHSVFYYYPLSILCTVPVLGREGGGQ